MRRSDLLKEQLSFLKEHSPSSPEIAKLETKLKRSKQGRSSKVKGANYERNIVKLLEHLYPDLKFGRTPASGGYKKELDSNLLRGDVVCLNDDIDFKLHLELKNHKGWETVKKWYKQAQEDCLQGKLPCVILHQQREAGVPAKDFILMDLKDFFSIIDDNSIIKRL